MNGEQDQDARPPGGQPPPRRGPVAPWDVPPPVTSWPYGPDRPGVATAAIVLGLVTGVLTVLGSFLSLVVGSPSSANAASIAVVLGLPCAFGLIAGALRLSRRDSPRVLFGSAVAAACVLLVALVLGAGTLTDQGELRLAVVVIPALVLPVLTAVFAWLPRVRGWAAYA